ncbi:MAG: hypothetical protein Q8Q09_16965 [Deltaproteobacteria bacterium]|nr:hypothetical protein [Deltaproteobacteria bacterium]
MVSVLVTFDQELRWMVLSFALMASIPVVPVLGYVLTRRRRRGEWVRVVPVQDHYRQTQTHTLEASDAPQIIKATAVLSWWLGQMILPGIQAVVLGRYGVVGVVGLPGLLLAFGLLLTAKPLLRGEVRVLARARWLQKLARWLNYLVIAVTLPILVLVAIDLETSPYAARDLFALRAALGTLVYSAISLAHARMLGASIAAIEANEALRKSALPGLRVAETATHCEPTESQPGDVAGVSDKRLAR